MLGTCIYFQAPVLGIHFTAPQGDKQSKVGRKRKGSIQNVFMNTKSLDKKKKKARLVKKG